MPGWQFFGIEVWVFQLLSFVFWFGWYWVGGHDSGRCVDIIIFCTFSCPNLTVHRQPSYHKHIIPNQNNSLNHRWNFLPFLWSKKFNNSVCFFFAINVYLLLSLPHEESTSQIIKLLLFNFVTQCVNWIKPKSGIFYEELNKNKYGCRCKASIVKRRGQVIYELVREPDV